MTWTGKARSAVREIGDTIVETGERAIDRIGDLRRGDFESRSKQELYEIARRRGISGRSTMTKRELIRALKR